MIVDLILKIVIGIFTGILGLFPAYELSPDVQGLGSNLGSSLAAANGVFPVVTLGLCLALMIGARLFIAAWAVLAWVYDKIPFKMT